MEDGDYEISWKFNHTYFIILLNLISPVRPLTPLSVVINFGFLFTDFRVLETCCASEGLSTLGLPFSFEDTEFSKSPAISLDFFTLVD